MKEGKSVETQLKELKELVNALGPEKREAVRDELLAWLLFYSSPNPENGIRKDENPHRELSEEEREIIRKLAEQTEALFRLKSGENNDTQSF